jgi:hypothetical protein
VTHVLAIVVAASALPLVIGVVCGVMELGLASFWSGFKGGLLVGFVMEGAVAGVFAIAGMAIWLWRS